MVDPHTVMWITTIGGPHSRLGCSIPESEDVLTEIKLSV